MEFITTRYNNLNDNYKRLVTLGVAIFLNFTVLLFFPINILMIYSLTRAYQKNKTNLVSGMKEEVFELYEQLKNFKNSDSLKNNLEKEQMSDNGDTFSDDGDGDCDNNFTEEDTNKVKELTSITNNDVAGILNSLKESNNEETKSPTLKKDE